MLIFQKSFRAFLILSFIFLGGLCSGFGKKPKIPPEFQQKVQMLVSEEPQTFQATRSGYDVGDLQAFHSQHTFAARAQDILRGIFSDVEVLTSAPDIQAEDPSMPPYFDIRLIDIAHDQYDANMNFFRSETVLAAAMKSPKGTTIWQQVFRGNGYVRVDPQFQTGLGPEQAVTDAIDDALYQMQEAILKNKQVKLYMRHYQSLAQGKSENEVRS
ncbi:MAG: hypothetical protein ACOY3K_02675 [Candidatus Omnitrophota bacterium]